MQLADRVCEPCQGGVPPMDAVTAKEMLRELGNGWTLTHEASRLYKQYTFKNFKRALKFVNAMGEVAEEAGHHPNFHFTWGEVELEIWTHKIGGLNEADFILAAKADRVFNDMPFNQKKTA